MLIPYHLQSLEFMRQERHPPCVKNLGLNLIWFALPATQWPDNDLLYV